MRQESKNILKECVTKMGKINFHLECDISAQKILIFIAWCKHNRIGFTCQKYLKTENYCNFTNIKFLLLIVSNFLKLHNTEILIATENIRVRDYVLLQDTYFKS